MHALWCYCTAKGEKTSIGEICDRFVRLDPEIRCKPEAGRIAWYREVYSSYQRFKHQLRPINR